ncbi:hypothetical protein [uncultured Prevotella sp.]|uniref:hypothetical protein n=1 Tax=uncultured Prevotella sp. TaxID=159272 RepID=UPI00260CDCD0|nr:hypothetical protein [uncultured Prevotella sp.]
MVKFDDNFTAQIQTWLAKPEHSKDDLVQGATYVLKLTRNQALFNTIMRRPERYEDKIIYELKKRLPMRLDHMTRSDVKALEAEILPAITPLIDTTENQNEGEETQYASAVGKRADHEQLPVEIQQLWDANAERWKKIKELYNTCKELEKPCDRYEYLKLLKETWYAYKKDFAVYDSYKIGENPEPTGVSVDSSASEITVKDVTNARAYISKNLEKLETMTDKGSEEYIKLKEKVAQRINVILNAGESFSDDMITRLAPVFTEINFDENKGTAETAQE